MSARRHALAFAALLAAGCGQLVEDPLDFKYVAIESPVDGDRVLGRSVFPVEVSVECHDVWYIDVHFDGWLAGTWAPGDAQAEGCSGDAGTYCVPTTTSMPLAIGEFWPGRMEATLYCASVTGEFASGAHRVYVSPFEALAEVPASARSLFAADGGAIAVSAEGLHRIIPGSELSGLDNRSSSARAFAVGADLYYYAPCDGLACDGAAPDLFRVDAVNLTPRGDRSRLGCAPLSVVALGDQRVIALGDCGGPRVRWSAADLSSQTDEPIDLRLTDRAAVRGGEVIMLGWRDDELVILAAGAAPPLAIRPTGVVGGLTALTADGARAAVLETSGRITEIDTVTGAVLGSAALPPRPTGEVLAFSYMPGTHRIMVAHAGGVQIVEGDVIRWLQPPVDGEGTPSRVRAAAPLDAGRIVWIADPAASFPATSQLQVTDGTTSALDVTIGAEWTLTAPPLVTADGIVHLGFDTMEGPLVVSHRVGAP